MILIPTSAFLATDSDLARLIAVAIAGALLRTAALDDDSIPGALCGGTRHERHARMSADRLMIFSRDLATPGVQIASERTLISVKLGRSKIQPPTR